MHLLGGGLSQPVDVQITEAEERFLRGFVRRQVLPWFAGCALLALILAAMAFAVATSLATPVLSESSREMGAARALGSGADAVAPAEWEAQLAELRVDFEGRLEHGEGGITKLKSELAGAVEEMKALRDRVARAERAAKSGSAKGAGPELASADLGRVLKRLQGLEARQTEIEQKREKFNQDTLVRLLNVEVGRDKAEENRLASDEKARQRILQLEKRLSQIEGGDAGGSLPASGP